MKSAFSLFSTHEVIFNNKLAIVLLLIARLCVSLLDIKLINISHLSSFTDPITFNQTHRELLGIVTCGIT